jgi:hypothetical protein
MMKSDTKTITIERDSQTVYEFVANPENLPAWAKGFARSIRRSGDDWMIETPHGEELLVRYVTNAEFGIVDFHIEAAPGAVFVVPSRVVPNGSGAEYIFTQFQLATMSDALFEGQVRTLTQELVILKHTLEVACPTTFADLAA